MWRAHKAAGRPWPVISPDPVIDYMVMEAVSIKARDEDRKAEDEQKRDAFKKDKTRLSKYR